MRLSYFGAASLWGFAVGTVAALGALQATGVLAARPGAEALAYVIPAAVLAVVGGLVVARAYREAKRQGR
jgi:hypothetical protein